MTRRKKIGIIILLFPVWLYLYHLCFRGSWVPDSDISNLRMDPHYHFGTAEDFPDDSLYWQYFEISELYKNFEKSHKKRIEILGIDSVVFPASFNQFQEEQRSDKLFNELSNYLEQRPLFLQEFDKLGPFQEHGWPYLEVDANLDFRCDPSSIYDISWWILADMHVAARSNNWKRVSHAVEQMNSLCSAMKRGGQLEYLIGVALYHHLWNHIAEIYTHYNAPIQLDILIKKLTKMQIKNNHSVYEMMRVEFNSLLKIVELIYSEEEVNTVFYRRSGGVDFYWYLLGSSEGNTKHHFKELFDFILDGWENDSNFNFKDEFRKIEKEFYSFSIIHFKDPLGYYLASMLMPALTGIRKAANKHSFILQHVELWLSLKRFEKENKRPAKSLEELIPVYAKNLPNAAIENKELFYFVHENIWYLSPIPLEELQKERSGFDNAYSSYPRKVNYSKE